MPSLIPFATSNKSVLKIASYLLKHIKGSKKTLHQYTYGIYRFSKWLGKSPDEIIQEATADKNVLDSYVVKIDDFIGDLQAEGLAPGTINNYVKGARALFRANSLNLILPLRVPKTIKYPDRAPTPELILNARARLGEVLVCAARIKQNLVAEDGKSENFDYDEEAGIVKEAKGFLKNNPQLLPILIADGDKVDVWSQEALRLLGDNYVPLDRLRPFLVVVPR